MFAGIRLGQRSGEKTFTLLPGVRALTVTSTGSDRTRRSVLAAEPGAPGFP